MILLKPNIFTALILYYFFCVSLNNMLLMSLERFYAIRYPFKYRRITKKKHCCFLALGWISGLPMIPLPLIVSEYRWTLLQVVPVVTLAILVLCTAAACLAYFLNVRKTQDHHNQNQARRHRKFVIIIFLITLGYFITCGIPTILIMSSRFDKTIFSISSFLYSFNGIADFLVYRIFDDDFIAFTRLLRKRIHHLIFLKNDENRSSMMVVFQVGNTGKAVNHY